MEPVVGQRVRGNPVPGYRNRRFRCVFCPDRCYPCRRDGLESLFFLPPRDGLVLLLPGGSSKAGSIVPIFQLLRDD